MGDEEVGVVARVRADGAFLERDGLARRALVAGAKDEVEADARIGRHSALTPGPPSRGASR